MDNDFNFETYLHISPKKFVILVNSDQDEKIYKKEMLLNNEYEKLDLEKLNFFLSENIFEIEKKLKNFVKKIFIILSSKEFFPVEISIKKNDFEKKVNFEDISKILTEARDCCKKTISDRRIIHLIVNNYKVNEKDYTILPKDLFCNSFSLDVSFFCISKNFIKDLEIILKKYQISLNYIVSEKYVLKFLKSDKEDLFLMAKKLSKGHNPNEAILTNKTPKNLGFFEKFFNFFN